MYDYENQDRQPESYRFYEEPSAGQQPPQSSGYYQPRPSTPMRGPRHPRRSGFLITLLVLALLIVAGYGVVKTVRDIDIDLQRTDKGFSLAVGPKNQPEDLPEEVRRPDLPESSEPIRQPAEVQPVRREDAVLELEEGVNGAENIKTDAEGALSLQQIYEKMIPSVVSISTTLPGGSATGTGILMSEDGYVITNHHVISGAQAVSVLTSDDRALPASLVGSDEASDLAVLKVAAENLTPAQFGDSDALRVGDLVVAIGDPLGLQLRGTMTDGIISAINRDLTVRDRKMTLIQTNAALNNGNSGGPLINCYGQVVGINTMKMGNYYSNSAVEGLGFAIPISVAKPIIDELIRNGYVAGRPAIGISGETLPKAVRAYYGLPNGIYLTFVNPESDAYAKGLREGDIITAINETEVTSVDEMNAVKNNFSAGDLVTLTVYRGGQYYSVQIILMDEALQ